jgi:hypothetical protein
VKSLKRIARLFRLILFILILSVCSVIGVALILPKRKEQFSTEEKMVITENEEDKSDSTEAD